MGKIRILLQKIIQLDFGILIIILVSFTIGSIVTASYMTNKAKDEHKRIQFISLQKDATVLKNQNDSLKNSIIITKYFIKENIKNYAKESDIIMRQSTDSDIVFFTNYLSENNKGLFGSNNSDTTQTD